tara:strand:- start:1281 stop:3089 length:1809 start_codon:yes stop_codon:yes gene_type:complete
MAAKVPIRAVFDGSTATGLAEFQSTEFIALAYGGLGASLSIGSAGQVLKVNSGADALEFGAVEAILNIDGMTDGSGITIADSDKFAASDGGTEKYVLASQIKTYAGSPALDDVGTGDAASTLQTSSGAITIDSNAAGVTVDGHTGVTLQSTSSGNILLDSVADIVLDAGGADVTLKDDGTVYGSLTQSGGELLIKSGSTPTTAATFSGANTTLAGTLGVGAITGTSTIQGTTITATTAFVPDASDGATLGSASLEFSDLYLADGAVINFGDDQDITLTHSADAGLTTNGTFQATTITATTAVVPDASDGAALGTTSLEWSDLYLADGAVIGFGDDQDVTLTHVADAGLLLNTTMYLTFRDSALKIYSSADGQLDIDADTEVEITATTVDLNGNLDVSGTYTGGGLMTTGGNIVIPNAGNIGSASDTDSIAIDSSGNVTASQNLTVTGNFTVNGTTTTVSTTNMVVEDNLIELNTGAGSNANDSGIIIERGSTGDNAIIHWDESADKFQVGTTTAVASDTGNLSVTTGTLVANVEGSGAGLTAGTTPLTALDIDGGTDIGAALSASDLIIVDDGAGGTNRKAALSRVTTLTDASATALAIALG